MNKKITKSEYVSPRMRVVKCAVRQMLAQSGGQNDNALKSYDGVEWED